MNKKYWILIIFLVIGVVWLGFAGYYMFQTEGKPEICIRVDPVYTLTCDYNGGSIDISATPENYQVAIEKNNCTIKDIKDTLNLGYCDDNINRTKYTIQVWER